MVVDRDGRKLDFSAFPANFPLQDTADSKVYVGGLNGDGRVNESVLEDAFKRFGTIRSVWASKNPVGFAFIEFDERPDALDAIRQMDGMDLEGSRLKVSMARLRPSGGGGFRGGGRGGGGGGGNGCFTCGEQGHFSRECPNRGGGRYGGSGGNGGGGGGYGGGGGHEKAY